MALFEDRHRAESGPKINAQEFAQRKKKHIEGRAKEAWGSIRTTLRAEEDKNTDVTAPGNKRSITHGMQYMYSIPIGVTIIDVLYNETCEEFVILDESGTVSVHRGKSGKHMTNFLMDDKLERLVFLTNYTRYIGLARGDSENPSDATFVIYSQNLKILSRFLSSVPVSCMLYNPFRKQLVTSGLGNIATWTLHYEETHILPEVLNDDCEELQEYDLTMMAYEHNAGYSQRIYCISNTTCFVFRATSLELLETKRSLHVRSISAVTYFNPSKALVTGSIDGTIKMWGEDWCVKVVFVGHNAPVVSLGVYPNGPFVVSTSSDNTIRVWSLETSDESLVLEVHSTATQIVSQFGYDKVATVHNDELYVYKVEEIFHLFTTVGEPVRKMGRSNRFENSRNLTCICEDSTIRIVCPVTGKVVNTVLFSHEDRVKDAYCVKKLNCVFCLFDNNDIVKVSLNSNPGTIIQRWSCESIFPGLKIASFCLYEHIGAQDMLNQGGAHTAGDSWKALSRATGTGTEELRNAEGTTKPVVTPILLFVGRNDGAIAQIDMKTSEVKFEVQAHEMSNITLLVENPAYDQLISAGTDKVVKIWKVFPYANVEPLVIVFPFYFPGVPTHVTVCKNKFFIAFQDSLSGLYSSVVHTQERTRFDHARMDDHTDKIVAVAANAKMKLFVSAGEDETLRIWSDHSRLIRCLRLNSHIWSVEFCSETGDLVVGISDHIYRIEHSRYFTKALMYRMMTMPFEELKPEVPVPYDETRLEALDLSDIKRLKAAHSSDMKFSTFQDLLPEEEQKDIDEARVIEESKFLHLAKRDAELDILKSCDFDMLKSSKKQRNERIQQIAFKKYVSMFFENVKVNLPESDAVFTFQPPGAAGAANKRQQYQPENEPVGFFPQIDVNHMRESGSTLNMTGFLPNSVALKTLYPEEALKAHEEAFKPREFTAEELEEMEFYTKQKEPKTEDDEFAFLDEDLPMTPPVTTKSDLMAKLQQAAKTPSPPPTPELTEAELEALEREKRVQEMQNAAAAKESKEEAAAAKKQSKPIRKLIARPKPKSPPPPEPVATEVVKDDSETSERPQTPLPEWLTRNKTQEWYEKFFPTLNERTFPKPWYPSNFAKMVLRYIKTCDMQYKASMVQYLKDLHNEWDLGPMADEIIEAHVFVLNKCDGNTGDTIYGRSFFVACVQIFTALQSFSTNVIAHMMCIYLEKDAIIKKTVVESLRKIGLEDPQKFFYKNMDSWDLPVSNDPMYKREVLGMCEVWLKTWMQKLVEQTEYVIEELKSGTMVLPGPVGKKFSKQKKVTSADLEEPSRSVVAVLDRIPGDTVDHVTPLEGANYFAECEFRDYMARGDDMRRELMDTSNNRTVLVLPKVAVQRSLPRLGELSNTKCKPRRETTFSHQNKPPTEQSLYGFTTHINLPLKQVYMNPFKDEVDELMMKLQKEQPVLLMLKTQQKFFLPGNSLPPPS